MRNTGLPWLPIRWGRAVIGWRFPGGVALAPAVLALAGCVTLPGQVSGPAFVPRIVDREYTAVWETLQAALRNEGAAGIMVDRQRGVIETAYRVRPGTKVVASGILGETETRNPLVQVRYTVRARPVGAEKTEVRLRTEIQYLDRTQGWVRAADDGSLADSFWRRFEQDLAYYGARPETWRPDQAQRETLPSASGPPQGGTGGDASQTGPR